MRMMSFALTERQLLDGSKTVTRRVGWKNLKPGTRLIAVRKAMGLKPGERAHQLCDIEVVSVRRERLDAITPADVLAEGFPQWTNNVHEFVAMFCSHMKIAEPLPWPRLNENTTRKMRPEDEVTRIEFRIVPGSIRGEAQAVLLP